MPDNPRGPGHPSDMPSSRSSAGGSDASSMQNSYAPPPAAPVSSGSNNHTRNIIIGAVVTVFSSTLIYYLTVFQNKNNPDSEAGFRRTREVTTDAWKSFLTYENVYTKNLLVYEHDIDKTGIDQYLAGLKIESEKFQKDLADLSQTKKMDKDLVKAMNRRLENERITFPEAEKFYTNLKKIANSAQSDSLKGAAMIKELDRWNVYYKGLYQTAVNDIGEIAKTLTERYGQPFSMNDFLVVQIMPQRIKTLDSMINVMKGIDPDPLGENTGPPEKIDRKQLVGSWKATGENLSLESNGKMSYGLTNGYKATGTWKVENNKLRLDETGGDGKQMSIWIFRVSKVTANSFTMKRDKPPYESYQLTRVK
jgi:hypothetical protein